MNNLEEMIASTMNVYKTAFEEGRKVGYEEGYREANKEYKEILSEE